MGISGVAYADTSVNSAYQQTRAAQEDKERKFTLGFGDEDDTLEKQEKVSAALGMNPLLMGTMRQLEAQLTSGIIGLGVLEDGRAYSARYAADSTAGNPVMEISVWRTNQGSGGRTDTYQVSVNQIDPSNATQLEMFVLCAHADAQEMAGCYQGADTYQKLLDYAQYSPGGDRRAKNIDDFLGVQRDWTAMVSDARIDKLEEQKGMDSAGGKRLQELYAAVTGQKEDGEIAKLSQTKLEEKALLEQRQQDDSGVPYSYLAKDGIIEYNGVVFVCDEKHRALHLGDTSNPKNCIRISLSEGGCLIVNRDNLNDLAKAIGMFSPEDVKLILQAIAQDAKVQQMKQQIDDETSGLGLAKQTEEEKEEETESIIPDAEDKDITSDGKILEPAEKGVEPERKKQNQNRMGNDK
ncbi:MAG: hypothetical protein NC419_06285 [Muribaculaceae bacterium]|nr:hypothetical protein [Muribaculaceae bacterium]